MDEAKKAEKLFSESIEEEKSKISNFDQKILLFHKKKRFSRRFIKNISNNLFIKAKQGVLQNIMVHQININKKNLKFKIDKHISINLFDKYQINWLNNKKEKKKLFEAYEQMSEMRKEQFKEMNKINNILKSRKKKTFLELINDLNKSGNSSCKKNKEINLPPLNYNYSKKSRNHPLNKIKIFRNKYYSTSNIHKESNEDFSFFDNYTTETEEEKTKREFNRKIELKRNSSLTDVYIASKAVLNSLIKHQINKNTPFTISIDKTKSFDKNKPVIRYNKQGKNNIKLLLNNKTKLHSNKSNLNHFLSSMVTNDNDRNINNDNNEGLLMSNLSNYRNLNNY